MGVVKTRPYYGPGSLSAAYYDVVTAADARLAGDVDAYAALAGPGANILELGAGSGRVLAGLAERGFTVTGVEIQAGMLAQARARLAALPTDVAARVRLAQGDMAALSLGETYDLVICTYYTLAHVGLAQHLRRGRAAYGGTRARGLPSAP